MPDPAAVYPLGGGRFTLDAAKLLHDYLDSEWNTSFTDSVKPTLHFAEQAKDIMFQSGDHIVVYTTSDTENPIPVDSYQFTNMYYVITIDMMTAGTRQHAFKMFEEARRVINLHRVDSAGSVTTTSLTGRVWLQWGLRDQPLDRLAKGFYRRVVDVEVYWRYRQIQT
jgi:hypothetical protein